MGSRTYVAPVPRRAPPTLDANRVGLRIRRLRATAGLTQEALAWDTGHAKSYLCEIESGKKLPSLEVLGHIATRLGVQTYDLLVDPDADARSMLVEASRTAGGRELALAIALLTEGRNGVR